ncbi:MAG: amidohydrolase [Oscillospiraceae bacterium]|nr:amidohydrolase [Oscillospiraceae bacterium]
MDAIERKILQVIDAHAEEIKAFGRDIFHHAELGYKEHRTAGKFAEAMRRLGMEPQEGLAVTGVKSSLPGVQGSKIRVAVMGELDALPISNASHTNPETGAAHCCGHNAQLTGVLGAAIALSDPEIKAALGGTPVFMAVPAEECVDLEFKEQLAAQGKIRYFGGKCEFIRIGAMDDIDLVVGHHSITGDFEAGLANSPSTGFVSKTVRYRGKASHAAGSPQKGVDALNAAALGMHALELQRESFRDKDTVRVHGFISKGGEAVNVIADDVVLQYLVRAGNIPAIKDANRKVDRAMKAGAVGTGAGVEISTTPGYLPTAPLYDTKLVEGAIDDLLAVTGGRRDLNDHDMTMGGGSTDYGDISYVLPLLQFHTGGMCGSGHNPNYDVADEDTAYLLTAKLFALITYRLLRDDAKEARKLKEGFQPLFSKEEYLAYMESMLEKTEIEMQELPLLD